MVSRCTSLLRRSWPGWWPVTLFAVGLVYATTSLNGEYHYWRAHHVSDVNEVIAEFQAARKAFPLNYQFRKGPAMALTSIALLPDSDPLWKEAALTELEPELLDDPTSAAILAPAITFELDTGHEGLAKIHYAMFKRVASSSPLNGFVAGEDLTK